MASPPDRGHIRALLRQYVELLAERNGYAPEENFEYDLWDALEHPQPLHLLSEEEAAEITDLAMRCDSWVAYDLDTGRFQAIDIDDWLDLLEARGH
jgi:hypothetical protein